MTPALTILSSLLLPALRAVGRGLDGLWPGHPDVAYDREPVTRRWIAECEGYRGVGDTRREATIAVLALREHGKGK